MNRINVRLCCLGYILESSIWAVHITWPKPKNPAKLLMFDHFTTMLRVTLRSHLASMWSNRCCQRSLMSLILSFISVSLVLLLAVMSCSPSCFRCVLFSLKRLISSMQSCRVSICLKEGEKWVYLRPYSCLLAYIRLGKEAIYANKCGMSALQS